MCAKKGKPKKKGFKAQNPEPDMDPAPEPAPYPQWDDIPEYPRPEISPYTTKPITLTIGTYNYAVPEYFLRPYPAFQLNNWTRIFDLSDIHPDIGHTFIHYLYTGTYETTKSFHPHAAGDSETNISPRAREFHLSMHAYHASRRYGLTGLSDLSKTYIRVFDIDVSTLYILTIAREISSTLPADETWFWEYVREKLAIAFEDDEPGLRADIASYGVGRDPFDAFLVSSVLDIYASALPGKVLVNGHGGRTVSVSEGDIVENEDVNEWDSEPDEPPPPIEEEDMPHAIDEPIPPSEPEPEALPHPATYIPPDEVPELDSPHSPPQVAISPSPPPASPTPLPEEDYDRWAHHYGTYTGPATGVPARLTTLIEEQSEQSAEPVAEDRKKPDSTDDWIWGFSKKKKKRGRHYDLAPSDELPHETVQENEHELDPPEPVVQEPPLSVEPEPEPEPGIPLPEPAVPERVVSPVEVAEGNNDNGWGGPRGHDFRFYSGGQAVAIAE